MMKVFQILLFYGLYYNYFFKWWFYASLGARKCFLSNDEYRNNSTMKEHDRQKEMRQKQTLNATVETANQSQWKDFKDKVTKVQDRLRIVSFAIQAIPTGIAMSREITKITDNQTAIIDEINTALLIIAVCLHRCSLWMICNDGTPYNRNHSVLRSNQSDGKIRT
jgi:hypothetical protein